jgi:peroxiredoxin
MSPRAQAVVVVAVVALMAAVAGAGVAWWRTGGQTPPPQAAGELFALSLPDANGAPQPLAQWRGRPLVVNFWATWCAPCVEEMPDLQRVRDEYRARGVEVVGLGIDSAEKIRAFRDEHRLTLPLLVAGSQGTEVGRTLGNTAGVLPYTVLIAADGRVVQRKVGQIRPAELRRWLDAQLGSP